MREKVAQLEFATRAEFRSWLGDNCATSDGIWLVIGKTKEVRTLSSAEALEEALCFGWIDGQMQSVDEDKYLKYFARRRKKSIWSEKNKATVEELRTRGLVTECGETAIEEAKRNGGWSAIRPEPVTDEQIAVLMDMIAGNEPAYTHFLNMPLSVKRTYTAAYLSVKREETRLKALARIIERLSQNLKPM